MSGVSGLAAMDDAEAVATRSELIALVLETAGDSGADWLAAYAALGARVDALVPYGSEEDPWRASPNRLTQGVFGLAANDVVR